MVPDFRFNDPPGRVPVLTCAPWESRQMGTSELARIRDTRSVRLSIEVWDRFNRNRSTSISPSLLMVSAFRDEGPSVHKIDLELGIDESKLPTCYLLQVIVNLRYWPSYRMTGQMRAKSRSQKRLPPLQSNRSNFCRSI